MILFVKISKRRYMVLNADTHDASSWCAPGIVHTMPQMVMMSGTWQEALEAAGAFEKRCGRLMTHDQYVEMLARRSTKPASGSPGRD